MVLIVNILMLAIISMMSCDVHTHAPDVCPPSEGGRKSSLPGLLLSSARRARGGIYLISISYHIISAN